MAQTHFIDDFKLKPQVEDFFVNSNSVSPSGKRRETYPHLHRISTDDFNSSMNRLDLGTKNTSGLRKRAQTVTNLAKQSKETSTSDEIR